METLYNDSHSTLYVRPIIWELSDFAKIFGGNTETIVNKAQRQFKSVVRQCEWLTTRAMLHTIFGQEINVGYTTEGKPFLCVGKLSLSISHSKTHVAVLLSDMCNIGVDIEQIDNRILRLASRIASPDEFPAYYNDLDDRRKAELLTALWTTKEAVYKSLNNQSEYNIFSDIKVVAYDKETFRPEVASVKYSVELRLYSFIHHNNICTFTCY